MRLEKKHTSKLLLALAFIVPIGAQGGEVGEFSAKGTGIVEAARSWDVSAMAENQIDTIHFIEGQLVKKGDLLVTFDQVFKKWDARIAELDHLHAEGQLELANEKLHRLEALEENQFASEVMLIEARIEQRLAEEKVESTDLNAQKAKALSDLQLIYAPFDGQMSAPRFRNNSNVIRESPELATLYELDPINVRVEGTYQKHQELVATGKTPEGVMENLMLVLELPDGTEYLHRGRLISTPVEYDPETGVGYSLASFPNPKHLLRRGMKVTVTSYTIPD